MDVSLKGQLDGIEAARQIRLAYDVPIIFISGYLEEKLLEKARSVKFTTYLIKPIMPDDIKSAIAQTFKNQRVPSRKTKPNLSATKKQGTKIQNWVFSGLNNLFMLNIKLN